MRQFHINQKITLLYEWSDRWDKNKAKDGLQNKKRQNENIRRKMATTKERCERQNFDKYEEVQRDENKKMNK